MKDRVWRIHSTLLKMSQNFMNIMLRFYMNKYLLIHLIIHQVTQISFSHDEMVKDEVALSIEEIIVNSEEEQKRNKFSIIGK